MCVQDYEVLYTTCCCHTSSLCVVNDNDFITYQSAQDGITEHRRLGGLNDRHLFSPSSGGWEVQEPDPADWISSKGPLCGYVLTWQRTRGREAESGERESTHRTEHELSGLFSEER